MKIIFLILFLSATVTYGQNLNFVSNSGNIPASYEPVDVLRNFKENHGWWTFIDDPFYGLFIKKADVQIHYCIRYGELIYSFSTLTKQTAKRIRKELSAENIFFTETDYYDSTVNHKNVYQTYLHYYYLPKYIQQL